MATIVGKRRTERRAGLGLAIVLVLPIIAHIALAMWTAFDSPVGGFTQFWQDPRDRILFFGPPIAYGLVVAVCLLRRRRALLLAVLAYGALGVLIAGELALRATVPPVVPNLPRQPAKIYISRGDWLPGNPPATFKISFNNLGVRGPDLSLDDLARHDVRILCVGGSTTENYYNADEEYWHFLTQKQIDGTAGKSVYIGNAGTAGSVSSNHVHMLRNYRYADRFNWVVVLCGMNDCGLIVQGAWDQRETLAADETFFKRHYQNQGVYWRRMQLFAAARMLAVRLGYDNSNTRQYMDGEGLWFVDLRRQRAEWLKTEGRDDMPENLERDLARYRENLRTMIRICREREQNIVFMTQPTMYQENLAPELEALCWQRGRGFTFTTPALARIMRQVNNAMMEVCAAEGVDCIDLDARVPKNTEALWDDCHFNINGNRIVADVLSEYFKQKLGETR